MWLFHNIGLRLNSNYNLPEEIIQAPGPISFDGVYRNVYEHREILKGKDVTLFVMGDFVGGDNLFDITSNPHLPLEQYCTWDEIFELRDLYQCKIGWHTRTHRNLCTLSDEEVRKELMLPPGVEPLLAYPYGNVDSRVAQIAAEMGFIESWSVTQGDDSIHQRKRKYFNW